MTITTTKEGTTDHKTAADIANTTSFTTATTTDSKSTVMSPLETAATNGDEDQESNSYYDDDKCEVLYSICVRNTNNDDDDNDDENSIEVLTTKIKIGKLHILNNFVFVIGSIFYVANACMPYGGLYNDGTLPASTLSPEAMLANATGDYDGEAWSDDTIALKTNQWISTYSILYIIASLAFVITGFLELLLLKVIRTEYYEKLRPTTTIPPITTTTTTIQSVSSSHPVVAANNNNDTTTTSNFAICNVFIKVRNWCSNKSDTLIAYTMIAAGFSGFLSSLFAIKYYELSGTLNWFSVTLFFIQGILMIYSRFWGTEQEQDGSTLLEEDDDEQQQQQQQQRGPTIFWILLIADFFFFYGATSDFVIALFDEYYRYTAIVYDDDDYQPQAIGTLICEKLKTWTFFLVYSTTCVSSSFSHSTTTLTKHYSRSRCFHHPRK